MIRSKIMTITLILLAVLAILYFLGNKSVHHEIEINASPQKVWSVLADTDSYNSWNPVMKLLEGEIKEGNKVKYLFTQDAENSMEIPSTVKKIVPNKLLNQGGGLPFVMSFDHLYIIQSSGNGTKLTIHEDYSGIGVTFWNPAPVGEAYVRLSEAIKKRSEAL